MSLFSQSQADPISSSRNYGGRTYPDPFVTYATLMMPKTIEDVLRWCEALYQRNGTYAMALRRVVRYFLTQLEITEVGEDQKKKWEKFLTSTLNSLVEAAYAGDDFMCYGNSFTSIYVPFRRSLRCGRKDCRVEMPLQALDWKFSNNKFEWVCPKCKNPNHCDKPIDRPSQEEDRVKVIRWNPHHIKIKHHPLSKQNIYLWDIPAVFKKQVLSGDHHIMETTPWEIVEAIKQNKMFQFGPDVIHHMKEEAVAGITSQGWGISRLMTNFTQAFHVQMLKLYNEVIAMEYIVPFRCISPAAGSANAPDPMVMSNMGSFAGRVTAMLKQHRKNPGGWNFIPYPIEYQVLGGEGMQMTPQELIDAAMDEMLNAAGVPAELYKGTLQIQAMPTALRLFQQSWPHYVSGINSWLQWIVDKVARVFNWDNCKVALQPVTLADDMENKQILLQLASANQVSKHRAFAPLGIDVDEDQKLMFEEQAGFQEAQTEFQNEMQQKQQLQQAMQSTSMQAAGAQSSGSSGGDPSQAGAGTTPGDVMQQADQMAQQLLSMPETERKAELSKIRKSNELLWSLVKAKMQTQRQQAGQQGVQALQGGQQGQAQQA